MTGMTLFLFILEDLFGKIRLKLSLVNLISGSYTNASQKLQKREKSTRLSRGNVHLSLLPDAGYIDSNAEIRAFR
jgi:hypothetical protein